MQASEIVRALLEPGAAPFAPDSLEQLLEVAWALKDICYAAWSSEPQRAAQAADILRGLTAEYAVESESPAQTDYHADTAQVIEVRAVADWTTGIAHLTRGEMTQAIERFDSAAAAFQRIGQIEHAAQTQVPMIMAMSMLGKYTEATACADQARQVFIEVGDTRSAGKVSLNLSALHERLGAYADAIRESRSAAVLFAQVGDRELSIMSDINTGNGLTALGDFDEALRIYARAKMRAKTRGFPVLEALADESVALIQLARGQYRPALAGLENSRRRYESLNMPQHLATAEKQLGDAYLELMLLPEAAKLFEQAINRFQKLNFPDEQAWAFVQFGRAQALMGRPEEAAASLEKAADLFARQGIDVGEATVNLARAELMLSSGCAEQALNLAERAAGDFDHANLTEGRLRADVVGAYAHLTDGNVELASKLFKSALKQARELQLMTLQVRCLTGQGLAAWAQGDLTATKSTLEAAVELFEDQRRALPGDDLRTAFLSDHLRPYKALLSIALEEHKTAPDDDSAAKVLKQLERVRARSLGERLGHLPRRREEAPDQKLRDRLNWLYHQVRRKEQEGEPTSALLEEMRSTELELLEHVRRARIAADPVRDPVNTAGDRQVFADSSAGIDISALQALMGDADALVAYGVQDDELFACVVTPVGVHLHRNIAAWGETLDALHSARFQIETLGPGTAPFNQHIEMLTRRAVSRLQRLHALLWEPVGGSLQGSRRVVIMPHAQLGLVPFAALNDGRFYLAELFDTAVVPSAQLAIHGYRRPPLTSNSLLALGESSQLPFAAEEAEIIGSMFVDANVFTGEKATISAMEINGGQADVVHLACHARFRSDNPMFSALHLADGPLTVELAETLHLRAGLVVLSGCETGRSELASGDEMVGLVRAFLIAGTARVLATAWPIDDEHTVLFMTRFYRARCGGMTPAEALRQAQMETMRTAPHPFYWAGFTLYGGF